MNVKVLLFVLLGSFYCLGPAYAADTNVAWVGHADGCTFQYANVDGVVTEDLVQCTIDWRYPDRAPSSEVYTRNESRVYDLRLGIVCATANYRNVSGNPICRTIEELEQSERPFAAELVRRFNWLESRMAVNEVVMAPQFDEFAACSDEQDQ